MDATKAHESEGASSIGTWARRELNQDAGLTRQMVRAAATFRDLPAVGEAARAGAIGFGHVNSFTYVLKHVGVEATRQLEEPLLDLAETVAPAELFAPGVERNHPSGEARRPGRGERQRTAE